MHRAYHEAAFVLRIPKSAVVWRQLWNSSIELQHVQLGSKAIQALAGALRCPGAKYSYLGLMSTGVDAAALAEVLDAVSSNPGLGLTQLNLGGNRFGVSGGEAVAGFFEEAKAAAAEVEEESETEEDEDEAVSKAAGTEGVRTAGGGHTGLSCFKSTTATIRVRSTYTNFGEPCGVTRSSRRLRSATTSCRWGVQHSIASQPHSHTNCCVLFSRFAAGAVQLH